MLNILINAIFTIIAKIGDIVMIPIVTLLSGLIPNFSQFYNSIIAFIDYSFTYLIFFFKLLYIPQPCAIALVTVGVAYLNIQVGARALILVMRIYEKFKP